MGIKDTCHYGSVEFSLQNGPKVRYGTFVMNAKEEIFQAFRNFSN